MRESLKFSRKILLHQHGELCDTAVTVSGLTWRFVFGADLDGSVVVPLDSLGRPYSDSSKEGFEVTMHRGRGYGFEANKTHITLTRETNAVATGVYFDNPISNRMLNC